MSEQDSRFGDGLTIGVLVGGLFGGVVGAFLANRFLTAPAKNAAKPTAILDEVQKNTEEVLGDARRNLEEKITQLNDAIELARQRLASLEDAKSQD
ncbi:hypothetical protein [Anthocerotibacter panamensis]|uniref:hypothetical protein n=1 Tax=Anthocerotibacter panamensis TaxID=2857077 RepID=UPI001C404D88|nr:hypothetical protein [Anthocerotibacter panamensis]